MLIYAKNKKTKKNLWTLTPAPRPAAAPPPPLTGGQIIQLLKVYTITIVFTFPFLLSLVVLFLAGTTDIHCIVKGCKIGEFLSFRFVPLLYIAYCPITS